MVLHAPDYELIRLKSRRRMERVVVFQGLSVVDAVLDSGIRLHFRNDDFEVLQFKIFTEHGYVELVDPFLRVFTESRLNFHDSFRNMEDEPGFFFNPFTENPEDFRENLD